VQSGDRKLWAIVGFAALVVSAYYSWQVRASGNGFDFRHSQNGYYNYLGQAFAHGRLALPIEPRPELLAQPNPWDPKVDDSLKMHDLALYRGHYYLYHGAAPAALLFAPWLLLTGRDLPENFALWLLCFGGFLFSSGALMLWLDLAGVKPGAPLLALMLAALATCTAVPYLLSRVWVYEIAIGGGYLFVSGAIFFLALALRSRRAAWFGISGLMFGLAVACRPHLGVAGLVALIALAAGFGRGGARRLAGFAGAFAFVLGIVALYNYARFDSPFEFGVRYLLAGPNQNRVRLAAENVLPGLYYWLACAPDFSPVFPWVRLVFRPPFNSPDYPFPHGYFYESLAGALFLAPVVILAVCLAARGRAKEDGAVGVLRWTAAVSSVLIVFFLAATGFTTQRYTVDFLPLALLVALAALATRISRSIGPQRVLMYGAVALCITFGAIVNMAFGISGPYDEMLKNRPASYLRIARWFSPAEQFRPMRNPAVRVSFAAEFAHAETAFREPLITMGRQAYHYLLYVEHTADGLMLISHCENSTVRDRIDLDGTKSAEMEFRFTPAGRASVSVNGREILVHDAGIVTTAPADVTVGENRIEYGATAPRFTGRIWQVTKSVHAGS
jgi:hypothetical protein